MTETTPPEKSTSYLAVLVKVSNGFSGYFPDLPGLISSGKNEATARVHLSEALALHLYQMRKDGDLIPVSTTRHVEELGAGEQTLLIEPVALSSFTQLPDDITSSG
jgi:predicted RNase H-like HicB family nuclease